MSSEPPVSPPPVDPSALPELPQSSRSTRGHSPGGTGTTATATAAPAAGSVAPTGAGSGLGRLRRVSVNPVLARELRQRMRGRATWAVVTVYLLALVVALRLLLLVLTRFSDSSFGNAFTSSAVGYGVFDWILFGMLILVVFIVPGLTAGALSGERERQTLTSLQVTLLSPRSIVIGKILAALSFVGLLVVASLPILSVTFIMGGLKVRELIAGVAMVLLSAFFLGCLGICLSTLLRRTQGATVMAYALTLGLSLGTFMAYGLMRAFEDHSEPPRPPIALMLNPFVVTGDVVGRSENLESAVPSPFSALEALLDTHLPRPEFDDRLARAVGPLPVDGQVLVESDDGFGVDDGPGGVDGDGRQDQLEMLGFPFWLWSLAAWGALGAGAVLLAARRITLPAERERAG
ncbi:MAG: ABC transporter permease [Acidimicrobiales bacterium]